MNDELIKKLARKQKVPIGTMEKDYAVTGILFLISQFSKIDRMAFKGGTALKKVHCPDSRFSEDIDFTCMYDVSEELHSLLDDKKKDLDFVITHIRKAPTHKDSRKLKVSYLGYTNHPNSVGIDLSLRGDIQQKPRSFKAVHSYSAIPAFNITSMTIEEIMAEKVRAVVHSRAPRHLYDLNYLLTKQIPLNPKMVRDKMALYGEDFDIEKFRKSADKMKEDWIPDLRSFLSQALPPFDDVSASVLQKISAIMG